MTACRATALSAALLLGLTLPGPATARGPQAIEEITTTPYVAEIEQIPCAVTPPRGDSVACFMATLPMHYGDVAPDGSLSEDAIRIGVHGILLENFIHHPEPNPIVFISGGPGQPASQMIAGLGGAFEQRRNRGVLLIDQRGTGASIPRLDCPNAASTELEEYRLNDPSLDPDLPLDERVRLCAEFLKATGVDFSAFSTRSAALDLLAIRRGLGLERWNLHGTSYGSRVVQDALRVDPEGIRAAVLNSVQSVRTHFDLDHHMQRVKLFERLFADCRADADCTAVFPDLREDFLRIHAHLEAGPLEIYLRDQSMGVLVPFEMGWNDVLLGLYQHMNFNPGAEHVARYIHELRRVVDGRLSLNDDEVARIFQPRLAAEGDFGIDIAMHLAVRCREDLPGMDGEAALAAAAEDPLYFPGDEAPWALYTETCEALDAGSAAPAFADLVESEIPVLVLQGDLDPLTPLAWAQDVAAALPNAQLVVFAGMGHDIFGTVGCARVLTANFFEAPDQPVDASCASLSRPVFTYGQ